MSQLRLFVCMIVAVSLFGQLPPPEEPPLSEAPPIQLPAAESQAVSAPPSKERELKVFANAAGAVTMNLTSSGSNGELWLDAPPSPFGSGVLLRALASTPSVFAQLGTATSSSVFSVANSSGSIPFRVRGDGTTLFGWSEPYWMRVYPNGHVALQAYGGDTGYNARLLVQHGIDNSYGLFVSHQPAFEVGSPAQNDTGSFTQVHENVHAGASNTGSIVGTYATSWLTGPGTLQSAIGGILHVGTYSPSGELPATLNTAIGLDLRSSAAAGSTIGTGYGLMIRDVLATNDYGIYQAGSNDSNYFAGNVAIGGAATNRKLEVYGDANFSGIVTGGNIQAKYQDLAEWVPATTDMEPGTVVVLNEQRTNEVMPSHRAYDTSVAGVVSAQPGVLLGVAGESKEQIATTGRVRVRVDASQGAIHVGDLLVTSDVPGTAMKSTPIDVGGIPIHRPGTIVGKALEPLESGVGEILVLLSLQ